MSAEEALTAALRDVEITREPGGYPHLGQDNDIRQLAKDLCDLLEVDGYTIVRSDEPARLRGAIETTARLQDALDALDMATLWLHRTFDLPHIPSHQAESWERKARSGRVALSAALEDRP